MSAGRCIGRPSVLAWLAMSVVVAFFSSGAMAQGERIGIAVNNPRAYGHVVGDRITRGVRLELPSGYRLERASLPGKAELNYWLDLVDVGVDAQAERGGRVFITLDYQLFYAPLQASQRELPAFTVSASNTDDERIEARVPGFVFTMSPIIELQPEAKFGDEDNNLVLPDERPALRDTETPRNATIAAFAAMLIALLTWLWAADRMPGRKHGPFARAAVKLRKVRRRENDETVPTALRLLHRAFDATAGHSVFAEDVDRFVVEHPVFADRRDDIVAFFDFSRRVFFDDEQGAGCDRRHTLDELARLARDCRRREIGA